MTYPDPTSPLVSPDPVIAGSLTSFEKSLARTPIRHRNPFLVWLVLPIITLGIYSLVWYYKIHREMADQSRDPGAPIAGPMLVMLFLGWTVIAPAISLFNTGKRIAEAQRRAGATETCNPWIGLILTIVFGLWPLYYQMELNKVANH